MDVPVFSRRRVTRRAAQEIRCIDHSVIQAAMEASKHTYPNEFAAGLSASGSTITALTLIPGTRSNFHSASFNYHSILGDFSTVGTIHSHPSGALIPSAPDRRLFASVGRIHVIVGYPFYESDWCAFDRESRRISLSTV